MVLLMNHSKLKPEITCFKNPFLGHHQCEPKNPKFLLNLSDNLLWPSPAETKCFYPIYFTFSSSSWPSPILASGNANNGIRQTIRIQLRAIGNDATCAPAHSSAIQMPCSVSRNATGSTTSWASWSRAHGRCVGGIGKTKS